MRLSEMAVDALVLVAVLLGSAAMVWLAMEVHDLAVAITELTERLGQSGSGQPRVM